MSATKIRWAAGDVFTQCQIADAFDAGLDKATLLHESAHRSVYRIDLLWGSETRTAGNENEPIHRAVIKVFHTATGRHPVRERLKRRLGRSPARREWIALEALHAANIRVPRPRAWGRLTNGDEMIVADYIDGEPVSGPIDAPLDAEQHALLDAMATSIRRLHDAGFRHGDLHLGNCRKAGREIALLDVQRARPQRNSNDRLWDLARLELSLARAGWSPSVRGALRDRLEVDESFDPILRRFLRDYLRGRARRVLRVGRNWSIARVGHLRGLRERSLEQATLVSMIEACENESDADERRGGRVRLVETKAGERVVLVKHIAAGNLRRALADRFRGSAAARAFRAGQSHALLTNRGARPLAFLEERRFGLPIESWLVLEKVGDEDLDRIRPGTPEAERNLACAFGEFLAEFHAWGFSHRDLKASNLRVAIRPDSIRFWIIDLEDLKGPGERSDELRLVALSQLNASLADDALGIGARLAGLASYEARVPFSNDHQEITREIARRSRARGHHWHGDACECRDR